MEHSEDLLRHVFGFVEKTDEKFSCDAQKIVRRVVDYKGRHQLEGENSLAQQFRLFAPKIFRGVNPYATAENRNVANPTGSDVCCGWLQAN